MKCVSPFRIGLLIVLHGYTLASHSFASEPKKKPESRAVKPQSNFRGMGRALKCLKENGNVKDITISLTDKEKEKLNQAYDRFYEKKMGKDLFRTHSMGGKTSQREMSLSRLYTIFEAYKVKQIDEVTKRNTARLESSKTKAFRMGDVLCSQIEKLEIIPDSPFNIQTVKFFGDPEQNCPTSLSREDFERTRAKMYSKASAKKTPDSDFFLLGCEVTENDRKGEFYGSMTCLTPNFYMGLNDLKKGLRKQWFPYFTVVGADEYSHGNHSKLDASGLCEKLKADPISENLKVRGRSINPFAKHKAFDQKATENKLSEKSPDLSLTGSFSGKTYDNLTKLPLPEVTIQVKSLSNQNTDAKGWYLYKTVNLSLQGSTISGSKKKYEDAKITLTKLSPDKEISGYDLYLEPKQTNVAGTVYNSETKKPVIQEKISIKLYLRQADGQIFSKVFDTETNSEGKYEIKRVPAIYNEISITPSTNAFVFPSAKNIELDETKETNTIDLFLNPLVTTISGTVTDEKTGEPLSGHKVTLKGSKNEAGLEYSQTTGEDGYYSFTIKENPLNWNISNGKRITYKLSASVPESKYYFAGSHTDSLIDYDQAKRSPSDNSGFDSQEEILKYVVNAEKNISLKQKYPDLDGYIKDARTGEAIPEAKVQTTINGKLREVIADEDGHYLIRFLPPGNYQITAKKEGWIPNQASVVMKRDDIREDLVLARTEYARNRIIIVLTWRDDPRDLDSQISNGSVLLNFKLISSEYNSLTNPKGPRAILDVDNTSGYGPETTMIQLSKENRPLVSTPYRFMVYNYSQGAPFKGNGSKVTVLKDGKTIAVVNSADIAVANTSLLWHVLDIVNGEVVVINRLKFKEEYDSITTHFKQINLSKKKIDDLNLKLKKLNSIQSKKELLRQDKAKISQKLFEYTGDSQFSELQSTGIKKQSRIEWLISQVNNMTVYSENQTKMLEERVTALETQIANFESTESGNEIEKSDLEFQLGILKKSKAVTNQASANDYVKMLRGTIEIIKKDLTQLFTELEKAKRDLAAVELEARSFQNSSPADVVAQQIQKNILKAEAEIEKHTVDINTIQGKITDQLSQMR